MEKDINKQLETLRRGVVEIFPEDEFVAKLENAIAHGRPLRVKCGFDPSAPDIHLGHTVQLRKLRQFQELGHIAVIIFGDYTAMVGDPSGRSKTRPQLTHDQTMENAQSYLEQVRKVVLSDRLEVIFNGDWFAKMDLADVITLTSKMTVARMLERDDFALRFKEGSPIAISEFLYPLMQGYDSVMVRADVELGATEQKFNLIVGRNLQVDAGMQQQACITMPVLPGTDGVRRMGKSLGNYIGVDEDPKEIYGKAMSIPDDVMPQYFELVTDFSIEETEAFLAEGAHPRDAKAALASRLVQMYHGPEAARTAAEEFDRVFRKGKMPEEIPAAVISGAVIENGAVAIIELLREAKLVSSNSEARRMIQQGAVKVNGEKVSDIDARVPVENGTIVQVGKRKFASVRLA
jgi:tyrosyl-tRNA synthetase